jgi:uncharacterized membrane protein YhaH (DUF805 family)
MSAVNPYTPPRADVSDVQPGGHEYSQPKVLSASGRIGRLRYLAYLSGATLVMYLALAAVVGVGIGMGGGGIFAAILMAVVYIPYIVLSFMLLIQRSHDMGWTGWTVLLALIPFVGLIWLFKAGTPGPNRFGNPPPPNTTGVKVLGLVLPVIGIVGILAAVALPAYSDYTKRAKAAQQKVQQMQQQQQQ